MSRGLVFLLFLCNISLAVGDEEVQATAKYSKGANQCMTCHREGRDPAAHEVFLGPMGISGAADSPFAEGSHDCETCHGPSASHRKKAKDGTRPSPAISFAKGTPTGPQNEICLGCHDGGNMIHWFGSVHEEEEVACVSCHEVHAARDPVFDKLAQQERCFACHPRTRAATFRASSHPLRFGEMTCSDCHNPHDGANDFLLVRSTVNDTCYTCHAEKRGPFLWEHAPVSEDCSLCHNPHGSNQPALLTQRPPLLCQQCHSPGGHPATAYTSESEDNSFRNRFLLAQSCNNCHSQVHGSNHPSGVSGTR
ncbi:MAG: DmsE family decaheme c-type cytochrome [Xanthomonadales bacterium]|nr:DmsE family decaheme c-type cytochrome [Xanthomonadales bacterium]